MYFLNCRNLIFIYKRASIPQFNTSVQHKDHTFSVAKIRQFNIQKVLVQHTRQLNTKKPSVQHQEASVQHQKNWTDSFYVLNWRIWVELTIFCVELADF